MKYSWKSVTSKWNIYVYIFTWMPSYFSTLFLRQCFKPMLGAYLIIL